MSLPFFGIDIRPEDRECRLARQLVIRLADRRVLSAWECGDSCIACAPSPRRRLRAIFVDEQVGLADLQDDGLYPLEDAMTLGIRQFLTFEDLPDRSADAPPAPRFAEFYRSPDIRKAFFDALEVMRSHLSRSLGQAAAIGGLVLPQDGLEMNYQRGWQVINL